MKKLISVIIYLFLEIEIEFAKKKNIGKQQGLYFFQPMKNKRRFIQKKVNVTTRSSFIGY